MRQFKICPNGFTKTYTNGVQDGLHFTREGERSFWLAEGFTEITTNQ